MLDLPTLSFAVTSMPLFSIRPFIAAFCVTGMARLQSEGYFVFLQEGALRLDLSVRMPEWLYSDLALWILALLALAEMLADKNPDIRLMLADLGPAAKALLHYLSQNAVFALSGGVAIAALHMRHAGFGELLWTALPAAGVWLMATWRRDILGFLSELDEDDDLGLRSVISWAEDGAVAAGTLVAIFLPALALTVAGLTAAGLWLAQFIIHRREARQRVPCPQCGERILPTATVCHACRTPVAAPVAAGLFGQPTDRPVQDLHQHRLHLLSKKRCFVCASRLRHKRLHQTCDTCGTEMLPSRAWADHYLAYVDAKLGHTLMVCAGLSLIPIFGLIPGIVYYRLSLVSSLRTYLPATTGCLTRWVIRAANLLLLALQWIPILGALTLPAMCYLNYRVYRSALEGHYRRTLWPSQAAATSP
ncbi:MAG: hypothetical protein AAGD06_20175 [Acidobacteriota bacterium]